MIKTVLVIDDDFITRFLTREILIPEGFCENLEEAIDGQEAINYFEKIKNEDNPMDNLPEVILLDLNMPVMDGWEFFETFSKKFPEFIHKTNIFIISSSINPDDEKRAVNEPNIAGFLSKPLLADEHLKIINDLLKSNK
jgi:CheY-like chemotaxis protein